MSTMVVDGLVFASAMGGTIVGHLLFYFYVWITRRDEDESEE